MKNLLISSSFLTLVTACGGAETGGSTTPPVTEPAFSTRGYANSNLNLSTAGQTTTTTVTLIQREFRDGSEAQLVQFDADITPMTGEDAFTVETLGLTIPVTWNGTAYTGTYGSSDTYIELIPTHETPNNQVAAYWVYFHDGDVDVHSDYYGPTVIGINSDPAGIAPRGGRATYNGFADVAVSTADYSSYAYANGTSEFEVNFATNTISGELNLTELEAVRIGDTGLNDATIIIDETTLDRNGFGTTFTVDPTDLGLASIDNTTVTGHFYGEAGSDIGGTFETAGQTTGGVTTFVTGSFVASED